MKFSIMNYHYLRYPLERFLDKASRTPFDCIELYAAAPHLNIFDYDIPRLHEVRQAIASRGLSISNLTPENCTYPINLSSQDAALRNSSMRYYQRVIDTAEYLGTTRVQLCPGSGFFDRPREEAWSLCVDSLGHLCEYAAHRGVTLILEELKKTTSNVINSSKDLSKMLDEVSSSSMVGMIDTDQMADYGENIKDYFDNLGRERVGLVHFNDQGHTVMGDGGLPMKSYFEALVTQGYEGVVSGEICDRRYYLDPDAATDRYVKWMQENVGAMLS